MNSYNTKFILTYFKPTPNSVGTPGMVSRGSCSTYRGDRNGDRGNSSFTNSSLVTRVIKNHISHLTITKSRAQSNQLNKVLKGIFTIYQDKNYDYIPDIISSNTKPTQDYFLSDHLIKQRHISKHYVEQGIVDPIIGLNVPSGNSPIDPEMVENTPSSNQIPKISNASTLIMSQS